jgi:thrombospondin type 3 repeat protein
MPARRLSVRPLCFALPFLVVLGLLVSAFATRTLGQTSPARGTAQVIAQGLTAPPADKVAWRVIEQPIPKRIDARPSNRMQASTGFLLADETPIFVADQRTKLRSRLAAGEAQFVPTGANQTWASLDETAGTAYSLELVDRDVARVSPEAKILYRSGGFSMKPGDYDLDLIRDDVKAGERAKVKDGSFPVLVLVTSGQVEVTSTRADDPVRLKEGQAIALRGDLTIRARGQDSTYVAAIMGDAVSGGEAVPTVEPTSTPKPKKTSTPEPEVTKKPKKSKTPEAEPTKKPKKNPGIGDGASVRIAVRLCREGMTYFAINPQACERADGDYQLTLVAPKGKRLHLSDASRVEPSFVRWSGLKAGDYQLVVGKLPDGYMSYSLDGYVCCSTNEGYLISVEKNQLIDGTLYIFTEDWGVGAPPAPTPIPAAPPAPQPGNPAPGTDSDGDGLSDELELDVFGTSPFLVDSDGDTIPDGVEAFGSNGYLTAPALPDTDFDGVMDNVEIQQGTDPLDPTSR